jgi:hypothetical protein
MAGNFSGKLMGTRAGIIWNAFSSSVLKTAKRSFGNRKMPSNVEIKAKVSDYNQFRSLAESVSGQKGEYKYVYDV